MLDRWPDEMIESQLGQGEKAIWSGRPRQGLLLRPSDAFLIPFSLLWGGFAIFWETMAIAGGAPLFFALFGVPFVLVGLYIMVGRFWADARQRAQTVYGVTSERVIIVSGMFGRQIKSLSIDALSDVSLSERSDGSGTITFGPLPPFYAWYGGACWPGTSWPGMGQLIPSLELAGEARQVYEMIRSAQRAAKQRV